MINIKTCSLSVYLVPELAHDPVLPKNFQQKLVYKSLHSTVDIVSCSQPYRRKTIIPSYAVDTEDEMEDRNMDMNQIMNFAINSYLFCYIFYL